MLKVFLITIICVSLVNGRVLSVTDPEHSEIEKITINDAVPDTRIKQTSEVDFPFSMLQIQDTFSTAYAHFLFGNLDGNQDKGMSIGMFVDPSLNQIVLPSNDQGKEGFNCIEKNLCIPKNAPEACSETILNYSWYYNNPNDGILLKQSMFVNTQQCDSATTFMRFTNTHEVDTTLDTKMDIQLYQGDNAIASFPGILGIGPNSLFFSYVVKDTNWVSNNKDVLFGLSYTPKTYAKDLMNISHKESWEKNSSFIVKGKKNSGNPPFYNKVPAGKTSWIIPNAKLIFTDKNAGITAPSERLTICLSTRYAYMVGVKDQAYSQAILDYFTKVCKVADLNDCPEKDAKKDNIKGIKIQLQDDQDSKKNYELEIDTGSILWWTLNNRLNPVVGQYFDSPAKYGCDDADIIIGRPFLTLFEAIFYVEKEKPDDRSIGFIPNKTFSIAYLIIFVVLGLIEVFVLISIVVVKCICRKKNEVDDYLVQE